MTDNSERRSGPDRRQVEAGPPARMLERRRRPERRQLQVESVSFIEWSKYFAEYYRGAVPRPADREAEQTAAVLGKAGSYPKR